MERLETKQSANPYVCTKEHHEQHNEAAQRAKKTMEDQSKDVAASLQRRASRMSATEEVPDPMRVTLDRLSVVNNLADAPVQATIDGPTSAHLNA